MPLPRLSARPPGPGEYTSPGAFNRRATIKAAANPTKGTIASAIVETWAAFRALSGQELDKAQQIAQRSTHLITIPYQPGILQSGSVDLADAGITRNFQIEFIEDPDERHVELRLMCFEMGQNAGAAV